MRKYRLQHANVQDLLRFTERNENGCLVWQRLLDKDGYPYLWVNSKSARAHSYICALIYGPRPTNAVTLHSCDNPSCINPDHLSWGTQRQNVQDKYARGRGNNPTGVNHQFAKLTEQDVLDMRQAFFLNNMSVNALAVRYRIHWKTARDAIRGITWKNVGGLP